MSRIDETVPGGQYLSAGGDLVNANGEPIDGDPAAGDTEDGSGLESMTVDELEALLTAAGVDLDSIEGSGKNGSVVKADLVRAAEAL